MTYRSNPSRQCARCGERMGHHDRWRYLHVDGLSIIVHRLCEWPTCALTPERYREECGEVAFERMKGLLYGSHNHRPQYAAIDKGEDEVATKSLADAIGLKDLFNNGAALTNLRAHADRLASEIEETAKEVGGRPENSRRYLDAKAVVDHINELEKIARGRYEHVLATSPDEDNTL